MNEMGHPEALDNRLEAVRKLLSSTDGWDLIYGSGRWGRYGVKVEFGAGGELWELVKSLTTAHGLSDPAEMVRLAMYHLADGAQVSPRAKSRFWANEERMLG